MKYRFLIIVPLILLAFYSLSSANQDEFTDLASEEKKIDLETATKLAMLVSYHADYSDASGLNKRVFPYTYRIFVDSQELQSLDGSQKYYSITLYRGEDEPRDFEELIDGIDEWVEYALERVSKKTDNIYIWDTSGKEFLSSWMMIYEDWDEYREYYNCIVPASKDSGFLTGFHKGIATQYYMVDFIKSILAMDLNIDKERIEFVRTTPEMEFVYSASGEDYIVKMPQRFSEIIDIEIIKGDEIQEMIKLSKITSDFGGKSPLDLMAMNEDIEDWLGYVESVEKSEGFSDSGITAYAEVVNSVLGESGVHTLYEDDKDKPKGVILDPLEQKKD